MTNLRTWTALLLAWLLLFFNIERFHEPLNIASFVYVLAALIAILVVVLRAARGLRFALLIGVTLVTLIVLKLVLGYAILGASLPITVTEVCALLMTATLGRMIAEGIREFEASARDVLHMHFDSHTPSLDMSQTELYREVKRARRFGRPLSVLAVSVANAENPMLVARYLKEIQERGIRKYVDARLSRLLVDQISDCDIIAYGDDRFFILLPEMTNDVVANVIGRLAATAQEELGVELSIGAASFPDEEVTLGGLFEKAEAEMRGEESQPIATPQAITPVTTAPFTDSGPATPQA